MSAPALSIRQPWAWAWAIVAGHKDVENRVWSTRHRGPLLIHAAQRIDREGLELMAERGIEVPELVRGAIVGRVRLVDVVTDSRSSWALPGLNHFLLEGAKPIRPVRCRGRLGLFIPDVLERVAGAHTETG